MLNMLSINRREILMFAKDVKDWFGYGKLTFSLSYKCLIFYVHIFFNINNKPQY